MYIYLQQSYIYFILGHRIQMQLIYVASIYLQVEKVSDPNSKNAKYGVYFYGTGET